MQALQWISRACFAIAILWLLLAWYYVWAEHRREVNRLRFVWGPDAEVPTFNPLDLIKFATMPESAQIGYFLTGLFVCIGLLARFLDRRSARKGSAS